MGISYISRYAEIPRTSLYSTRSDGRRSRKSSSFTVRNADGIEELASDFSVVKLIANLFSHEFLCCGYKKVTKHLQNLGYKISRKKVRWLMRGNSLLNHSYNGRKKVRRVIDRKLSLIVPNEVWEMNIKYVSGFTVSPETASSSSSWTVSPRRRLAITLVIPAGRNT